MTTIRADPCLTGKARCPSPLMTKARHTIAVIDDDCTILRALERLLTAYGYDVELYPTTIEFSRAAKSTMAKCLIVDCQVGAHSGIQMMRDLLDEGIQFPTIFFTGSSDDDLKNEAMALNCVAYLRKPVDVEQLVEAIIAALQP